MTEPTNRPEGSIAERKTCATCKQEKAISAFWHNGRGSRRASCGRCEKERRFGSFARERFKQKREQAEAAKAAFFQLRRSAEGHSLYVNGAPVDYQDPAPAKAKPPKASAEPLPKNVWETLKKGGTFHDLCNALDCSPKRLAKLIEEAKASGVPVDVVGNHVGALLSPSDSSALFDLQISPAHGELQRIGVISDLHFGSKYCLTGPLQDFVNFAYEEGIREILVPGDMLEGCYSHAAFERSAEGLDAQVEEMLQYLPKLDGLSYHAITGNHDWTFTNKSGVNVGKFIEAAFAAAGRNDFKSYGDRGAYLQLRGARIHMWHPQAKPSYARSYQLQKKIEGYHPGEKPQILLAGHWHRSCYFEDRGVHAISCPTFQGGGNPYGNSLSSGPPCIGGLMLSWRVSENGTLRDFAYQRRSYFMRERTHNIVGPLESDVEVQP